MSLPSAVQIELKTGRTLTGGIWTDITAQTLALRTSRGRQSVLDICQTGELEVVIEDLTGQFSIHRHEGTDPSLGPSVPRANMPIRVLVQLVPGGPVFSLFYGYTTTFTTTLGPGRAPVTTIRAHDRLKIFNRRPYTATHAAQSCPARIAGILDAIGVATSDRNIPGTGTYSALSQSATTYQDTTAGSAMQGVASDDGGLLFVSGAGITTYHSNGYRSSAPRATTSQLTLTNREDTVGCWVEEDLQVAMNEESVANYITVTDSDGVARVAQDTAYISDDDVLAYDLGATNLPAANAQTRANQLLNLLKNPRTEFDTITVSPIDDPAAYASVMFLELSDRVTVALDGQGGTAGVGTDFLPVQPRDCHIERIAHTIAPGPDATWKTSFALSRVAP